jgi:uncharacterized damage-inducible protein DinB
MNKHDLAFLYDYNYWANARVISAAARVSPEQYAAPAGLSHGSLRGTLVHILAAEVVWRLRVQEGVSPPALPAERDYPDLDTLRAHWAEEERAMRAFVAGLSDEAANRRVSYKTTKGVPREDVLWRLLAHVVNHGTQFRGEAGVALTGYGQSPGDLDLLAMMRERQDA